MSLRIASACRTATVGEAIAREIGHPLDHVLPRSRLAEELGLDLFDVAELVDALETKFRTHIPDEAWRSFRTVADIERFLRPTWPGSSTTCTTRHGPIPRSLQPPASEPYPYPGVRPLFTTSPMVTIPTRASLATTGGARRAGDGAL